MAQLELSFLGGFQVIQAGQAVTQFRSNKVRALLAYLAVEAERPHTRAELAGFFWPELPEEAALNNLSQTLGRIRQAFGNDSTGATLLLVNRQAVQLNPASEIRVDVTEFERLVGLARRSTGVQPEQQANIAQLEAATAYYQGDFLPGFALADCEEFESWLLLKRAYLQRSALDALYTLTAFYLELGDFVRARQAAQRQLALDSWREEAHRQLMTALVQDGQRNEALQQFERCRHLLLAEAGVEPEPATVALYQAIKAGGSEVNATPATLVRPRHNLLGSLATLIGRQTLLETLVQQIITASARLLTLVGAGGVGKTRLALAVAQRVYDWQFMPDTVGKFLPTATSALANRTAQSNGQKFADGVWFVALAGLDEATTEEALALAIVHALGFTLAGAEPAQTQLLGYLRQKQLLLVLDNFEHLINEADFVLNLLHHAPQVTVLVTSRTQLNLAQEHIYPLDGLLLPPPGATAAIETYSAVQLFVARAHHAMPTFAVDAQNVADIAQICALLQGLPLGLELAAQWVQHFTCAEIAASIQQNLDFLVATNPEQDRHRSLRAVFTYSWSLLTVSEQRALAQLALFRGGFSRQAALAITQASLSDLTALLSKSLVRLVRAGRYELHELLRLFAGEQLTALAAHSQLDLATLQERHLHFYCAALQQAEPQLYGSQPQTAVQALRIDLQNVQMAWQGACQQADSVALERGLRSLARFYRITGSIRPGAQSFQLASEACRRAGAGQSLLCGYLLIEVGRFQHWLADFAAGIAAAQAALTLAQDSGSPALEAAAHSCLALLFVQQGRYREARPHLEAALPLLENAQATLMQASLMPLATIEANFRAVLGRAAFGEGDYAAAQRHLAHALQIYQAQGDRWEEAQLLTFFGVVSYHLGAGETGRRQLETGLQLYQSMDDQLGEATILQNMGGLAAEAGDYVAAQGWFQRHVSLMRERGIRQRESAGLSNLGLVAYYLGRPVEARQHFEDALVLSREIGDAEGEGMGLIYLALLQQQAGDYAAAQTSGQQALQIAQAQAYRLLTADAWLQIGHAQAGLRAHASAIEAYQQAIVLQNELGHRHMSMEALAGLARVAVNQGDAAHALLYVQEILAYLTEHPLDGAFDPFQVYLTCYRVLQTHNDVRAAQILAQAHTHLVGQADKINDEQLRQSFFVNVATHQEIMQAWQRHNGATGQ